MMAAGVRLTDPLHRAAERRIRTSISPGDGVTKNVYVHVSKRTQTPWDEVQIRWHSHVSKPWPAVWAVGGCGGSSDAVDEHRLPVGRASAPADSPACFGAGRCLVEHPGELRAGRAGAEARLGARDGRGLPDAPGEGRAGVGLRARRRRPRPPACRAARPAPRRRCRPGPTSGRPTCAAACRCSPAAEARTGRGRRFGGCAGGCRRPAAGTVARTTMTSATQQAA